MLVFRRVGFFVGSLNSTPSKINHVFCFFWEKKKRLWAKKMDDSKNGRDRHKQWPKPITRWWIQTFFIFIPTWGNDPICLIFFRWVETTNQITIFWLYCICSGYYNDLQGNLSYPAGNYPKALLKIVFLLPGWDMLVSWRVSHCKNLPI